MSRQFTLSEANALLSSVEPLLRHLVALKREYDSRKHDLRQARAAALWKGQAVDRDTFMAQEAELEFYAVAFQADALRLQEMGVELKDLENGLVDFPTRVQGEDAYLCWRLGEPEVLFWHGLEDGFAGRRPVTELPGEEDSA
ncbi:MAG: DUF2203 domain-containing protein [Bacillota bacterium]